MSSDISTTLTEVPNTFFGNFFNMSYGNMYTCSIFNLKLVLFIILVLILVSCSAACMGSLTESTEYRVRCTDQENFGNDSFYSYKDAINPSYSNYQSTGLTAPNTQEGNPSNLLFGQANRLLERSDQPILHLDVFCNLYVLNGNPFGNGVLKQDTYKQKYLVYLKNKDELQLLDELKKENDGIYKLKYKTKIQDDIKQLMKFNEIVIVHSAEGKEIILLQGKFTIA